YTLSLHDALPILIRFLQKLLKSDKMMREVIKEELVEIKQRYADPRRTTIVDGTSSSTVKISQLLPDEQAWVTLTKSGRISRTFNDQKPKVTTGVKDAPRVMLSASV